MLVFKTHCYSSSSLWTFSRGTELSAATVTAVLPINAVLC